jgi:hypothetical protein
VVPPEAEVIILGKLVDPVVNTETTMVSAVSTFARKTGLLMVYGLVKPENECIPLSLVYEMVWRLQYQSYVPLN